MAWAYFSRIFSFSHDGSNDLGHAGSTFDTDSPSASQPSLAESSPAESNLAESALVSPNQIVVDLNNSPKSILVNSEVPNDIIEALNETTEPILAESPPEIVNNTIEALNTSPVIDLQVVDSTSEFPDDSIEAVNQSPESDPADCASEITYDIDKALNKSPESNLVVSSPTPQTSPYGSLEPNLNISEVSLLIRTARKPGNKIALKQVKALFKKAAKTMRKKLTPTQIYIIDNWDSHSARSRRSSTFSLRSTADPPSQATQSPDLLLSPPKIFVDASTYGIGFILNDRWLAWTFTPNHPNIPLGPNNKIIISWGELIAVELGILTLVSCGYRDTKVLVKSDSTEAVDALMKGMSKPNHGLDNILTRIFDLCNEARLELEMDLIPGKENPADGPSRGEYPPPDLMLDHSPRIPWQLQGLVIPVEAASASLDRI